VAVIVVGGHSRSVGKTSVVAGLLAALPERRWTAVKITQFGHGVCSQGLDPCGCALNEDEHAWSISEEQDAAGGSDTARFLAAGAERALWVRTRQGRLAEAMPELRRRLAGAADVILESNSVMRFLRPDLYLTVLDPGTADFKDSAREFLDRADAVVLHEAAESAWQGVSLKPAAGRPVFRVKPPEYVTAELAEFVRRAPAVRRGSRTA
jgi:molybdopterin-guanine dinucleotide biosynthesis protein